MPETPVTIFTIGGGVLAELFDRELERVVTDILDLNSEAKAERSITIKVAIKPDENRNFGQAAIFVGSSLGKPKPAMTQIFFGRKGGKIVAVENNPQAELFDKTGPRPVVDFDKNKGEANGQNE